MLISLGFILSFLASQKITADDVLGMMARAPVAEMVDRSGHWDRQRGALTLAKAIATVAPNRETAALMTVYAIFEGGMTVCAVGDHGKSFGPFQLQGVPRAVACDAEAAARVWLERAETSEADCTRQGDEDAALAELASGSCHHGRVLARRRAALARSIAVPLTEE